MFKIGKIIVNEVRDENIPNFPLDDIVSSTDTRTREQVIVQIEKRFEALIVAMLDEAVSNNKTYRPSKTAEPTEVWDSKPKSNNLPHRCFYIGGNYCNFRSVNDPTIILDSVPQEGYEKYNDYLWVKTEKFEGGVNYYTQAQIRISSLTDQNQFGVV